MEDPVANEFAPGDMVELKSGGPRMTVESVEKDIVICTWFETAARRQELRREAFPPVVLVKPRPRGPGTAILVR